VLVDCRTAQFRSIAEWSRRDASAANLAESITSVTEFATRIPVCFVIEKIFSKTKR
jgi:hypothetical protein